MSLSVVQEFLQCDTPELWLDHARDNLEVLLIDHARCEKKAASTALSLMFKYPEKDALLDKLSRLAREELRHFEQVFKLMRERGIKYRHLSASRYANALRAEIRKGEKYELVDLLIIGAYIEARSCERFAALAPVIEPLDGALARYYRFLLKSESRHFTDYLALAEEYSEEDISSRVAFFGELEAGLIHDKDQVFRFHSGAPG